MPITKSAKKRVRQEKTRKARNKIVSLKFKANIKELLEHIAKKNKTKDAEEYSVENPATREASSSARSKGNLFVSANAEIKKTINIGNKGNANQTVVCASTIFVKFNEPTHKRTVIITNPIETS